MIVLLGKSGSGKSTLVDSFVKRYPEFRKVVTVTTRPIRDNEVNGVDYDFVTEDYFRKLYNSDCLCSVSNYRGWYYGFPTSEIKMNNISVLTPKGLREIIRDGYQPMSFLLDVDRETCLKSLINRGDNIEEAYRRNLTDVGMFDGVEDEVDFVIYNRLFEKSTDELADEMYKLVARYY